MHITCSKKKKPYLESISYRVQKLHSYSDMELRLIALLMFYRIGVGKIKWIIISKKMRWFFSTF